MQQLLAAVLVVLGLASVGGFYFQLAQGPGSCDDSLDASCRGDEPPVFLLLLGAAFVIAAGVVMVRDWRAASR